MTLNRIYNKCCYYYNSIENSTTALNYAQKAVSLSNKLDISTLKFYSYKNLSITYLNLNDYKNAFFNLKKANLLANKSDNLTALEYSRFQNTLGYSYYVIGKFDRSIECHLKAFIYLYNVKSTSYVLDESIKTFNNLSNSFKMLGEINKAIYFCKLATKITENITFKNKSFDIFTLYKQHVKLGILYGFFMDDYNTSIYYFNLSKKDIKNDITNNTSIRNNLNIILNTYFEYKNGNLNKSKLYFKKCNDFFANHCKNNIFSASLFINFCTYFSNIYKDNDLLSKTKSFSKQMSLTSHYIFYENYFINNLCSTSKNKIDLNNYAFNFVLTLSIERHHAIAHNKQTTNLKLLENFSKETMLVSSKKDLFAKALETFNTHFFSQGFVITKYTNNKDFATKVFLSDECNYDKSSINKNIESFIKKNNLLFNYKVKEYDIFSNDIHIDNIKSLIIYYLYDNESNNTYFFTIFNDYNSSWILTNEEAKTALVLTKNLFLKFKNIHYTDKIKEQSLIDSMTKLHNSKYFWSKLGHYIHKYNKKSNPFSMVLMDINKFKNINDTFGHTAGDDAIKFFSKILNLASIPHAKIIRYGGDEFIIIFPDLTKEIAYKYILQIKNLCKNHLFYFNNTKLKIDFAFGLLEFNNSFSSKKDFFNKVDLAMYQNKKILKNTNLFSLA